MPCLHWSLISAEIPGFPEVLHDLFHPPAADLARYLGVSRRTVQRWIKSGDAPRPVVMALHRISRVGQHQLHSEILHELRTVYDWALSSDRQVEALQRELARVVSVGDFGAANAPSFAAQTPAELLAGKPRLRIRGQRDPS